MKEDKRLPSLSRNPARRIPWIGVMLFLAVAAFTSGCLPRTSQTGYLKGRVTIGPLVPVLREGETEPTPSPEMFAERRVVIYNARGSKVLQRVQIDASGEYEVELPAGMYTVDINRIGIDNAAGLPTQIEIEAGKTTRLDISIDTGIR
jgi:hypothetical protein